MAYKKRFKNLNFYKYNKNEIKFNIQFKINYII